MKSKAFNFFLLLLLSGANITYAQNKVYGIVRNDKGFSTNDVFIYDDNNKFLTTLTKRDITSPSLKKRR